MSYVDSCYVDGQLYSLRDSGALHIDDWIDTVFPVGFIYMTMNPEDPSTYLGGSWVLWGQGRVPVCVDSNDPDFSAADMTGGRKDTVIPKHSHTATFTGRAMSTHNHIQNAHNHSQNDHRHSAPYDASASPTRFATVSAGVGISDEVGGAISGSGRVYPYLVSSSSYAREWQAINNTDWATATNKATTAVNNAASAGTPAGSVTVSDTGQANVSNANLQPYITCYMWRRVQ